MTVDGVMKKSSNIGTAKIINKYYGEIQKLSSKMDKWHMTSPLGVDILGEGSPIMHRPDSKSWSNITLPVMGYGYGLQLTPDSNCDFL